jgi:hypothetical protein
VDLTISNDDGSNVNILSSVLVNGNLAVTKLSTATGYNELQILNSTIIGDTAVDNIGAGSGDTKTLIDNSKLQGGGPDGTALTLENGLGEDIIDVRGNSQFGTGIFIPGGPVVTIDNDGGASRITFTGASAVAGPGTTTVYGDMNITNAANVTGTLDELTFNGTNVLGEVTVTNGAGSTKTVVTDSTIGSHLSLTGGVPTLGGPMQVSNDAGYDEFQMTRGTVPWGLIINNDVAGANASTWGSATTLTDSAIGTSAYCLPIMVGDSLRFLGDNGRDVVNVSNTTLGRTLNLQLFNGNNDVSITNGSAMASLSLVGGIGDDTVLFDNSAVDVSVAIDLGAGADKLTIKKGDKFRWPNPLLGSIAITGGVGVDTTNLDAITAGALGFEVIVS